MSLSQTRTTAIPSWFALFAATKPAYDAILPRFAHSRLG